MIRVIPACLVWCLLLGATWSEEAPPLGTTPTPAELAALQELTTPSGQIKLWLSMARKDDFTPVGTLIPQQEWTQVERVWKMMLSKQGPEADAQLDKELTQIRAPQAIDGFMIKLKPKLDVLKPDQIGLMVRGFCGLFAQQAAKPGTDASNDPSLQGFLSWSGDVATWVEHAGFNDPDKARTALTALIACVQDLQVSNTKELRQTTLKDMLPRFGKACSHLKDAFRAYDVNLNAIIDSIKITHVRGTGVRNTVTLSCIVFDRERHLDIDLIKRGSTWELVGFKGQPFLPLAPALEPLLKSLGIGNGVKDQAKPVEADTPPGTL